MGFELPIEFSGKGASWCVTSDPAKSSKQLLAVGLLAWQIAARV